jgi:hypothetical protein
MKTVYVNSNWEYKAANGVIVDIKDHTLLRGLITNAVQGESDGISNAPCLLTGDTVTMYATEKLKRDILGDDFECDFFTEEEIEFEDANFGGQ